MVDHINIIKRFLEKISYKTIPIKNKNGIVDYCIISRIDYKKVNEYSWHFIHYTKKLINSEKSYVQTILKKSIQKICLHQLIMGNTNSKYDVIDHIDGNTLNNRRYNLRFVSKAINAQNRIINKNTTSSIYIGVHKVSKKWRAAINRTKLGTYDNEIDAAKQYDRAALIIYGKDCKTNNLINYEEVNNLILNDILVPKKNRILPKNIILKRNKYVVQKIKNHIKYRYSYNTLNEAINKLNDINQMIEESILKTKNDHFNQEIKRDENNNPIISIIKNNTIINIIVDDDNWHELSQFKWYYFNGYIQGFINQQYYLMHHYILNVNEKKLNGNVVDHKNNIRHDNRKSNLQIKNQKQNAQNRQKKINCSSKFKGVYKSKNKWIARINMNNKRIILGYYEDEYHSAIAYNIMAIKIYGYDCYLNKIDNNLYLNDEIVSKKLIKKKLYNYR